MLRPDESDGVASDWPVLGVPVDGVETYPGFWLVDYCCDKRHVVVSVKKARRAILVRPYHVLLGYVCLENTAVVGVFQAIGLVESWLQFPVSESEHIFGDGQPESDCVGLGLGLGGHWGSFHDGGREKQLPPWLVWLLGCWLKLALDDVVLAVVPTIIVRYGEGQCGHIVVNLGEHKIPVLALVPEQQMAVALVIV